MATINTLGTSDSGAVSRTTINDNFTNLNTDKVETSYLDTDPTLAADSDVKVATQKATKAYVDSATNTNYTTTNVFNGTTVSVTWTDLDLSATVGTESRVVLLKVYDSGAAGGQFFVRTNGDTGAYEATSASNGIGAAGTLLSTTANDSHTLIVKTDSSGVIEYRASGAFALKVDVLAQW